MRMAHHSTTRPGLLTASLWIQAREVTALHAGAQTLSGQTGIGQLQALGEITDQGARQL